MCPQDSLAEIDEALKYALEARAIARDSKKPLIDGFINDLLDARLEASK